ncbi:MAG: tryptophan 2,3-dioxygenase family protein [Cytophagales bacterium]|nr:tryptophan 2,3-dioxygenase family protein [Cytophagales bacterium]MDW8383255.1 tryptophan 2,3-dioxygenase family protein [Flammeovirgaceae bacterium]
MENQEKINLYEKFDETTLEKLLLLSQKYEAVGQDLKTHLEGMLYANHLTYWHYINLDALLSLQIPRTSFPDEMVFIVYHQITELYFKLIINDIQQICQKEDSCDAQLYLRNLKRVNGYLRNLISSFDVVMANMDKEQFLKFRLALVPASGFQSVQYRIIEILSTDFKNLVAPVHRPFITRDTTIEEMFPKVYWKQGAIEKETGKKTLTLEMFEEKYGKILLYTAREYRNKNLLILFENFIKEKSPLEKEIVEQMRLFDTLMNVDWPLVHYRSAVKYLKKKEETTTIPSTGGTNWQKYLPPRYQLNIFFPELWSDEELKNWGKG